MILPSQEDENYLSLVSLFLHSVQMIRKAFIKCIQPFLHTLTALLVNVSLKVLVPVPKYVIVSVILIPILTSN